MANYLFSSYNALSKIFKEGAYVSDAVYKEIEGDENADIIYRIVMGVLEKNNELDFKLSKLVDKRPKSAICIVLKQGIYCLDYMDSLPDYAVVNNSVDLAKTINKGAYKGFVNAVLKRAATEKISLPDGDGTYALSIRYGYPEWAINKIFSEYGREKGKEIVAAKKRGGTHVRTNGLIYSDEKFERDLENAGYKFEKTKAGYYVSMNPLLKKLFIEGRITYQSLTSTYAALALDVKDGQNVLDVCSAPGGKAIFVAEKKPTANVVACDIHPHRVELIGAYARRMHVKNVTPTLFDGTAFNKEWGGAFRQSALRRAVQRDGRREKTARRTSEQKRERYCLVEKGAVFDTRQRKKLRKKRRASGVFDLHDFQGRKRRQRRRIFEKQQRF